MTKRHPTVTQSMGLSSCSYKDISIHFCVDLNHNDGAIQFGQKYRYQTEVILTNIKAKMLTLGVSIHFLEAINRVNYETFLEQLICYCIRGVLDFIKSYVTNHRHRRLSIKRERYALEICVVYRTVVYTQSSVRQKPFWQEETIIELKHTLTN